MKLAVSSIAWTNEEEPAVAELLQKLGVRYVEIAPTKQWNSPADASDAAIDEYKTFWRSYGIEIVAFQSMLFNRPDLKLFESEENRQQSRVYLQDFIRLAGKMGVARMVFGSPKNRQRGALDDQTALKVAREFFTELGNTAQENGVCFCIEPNPADYGCDFITDAAQGLELVKTVGNEGFGLHLDIAGMTLVKDDVVAAITNARDVLKHFHISSPFLEQVEDRPDVAHTAAAVALTEIGYQGFVSIEMRPAKAGQNLARVERAVSFAQNIYS